MKESFTVEAANEAISCKEKAMAFMSDFGKTLNTAPRLLESAAWRRIVETARYRKRYAYAKSHCWFIPTLECVDILGEWIGDRYTVEVFAGNGYLATHLGQRVRSQGGLYRAYDNASTHHTKRPWRGVSKKNAFSAPIKKADVIVMTWPAYADNHAYRIARKMVSGQYLVFNGESYGGCTGDDDFHELLLSDFEEDVTLNEELDEYHVRWNGINDFWKIYRKK